jgi:membrane-associated phospholipid phosphatase
VYSRILISILLILALSKHAAAQNITDSTTVKTSWKRVVLAPAVLVSAGLIAMTDNEVFDKWEIEEGRNEIAPNFHTHADDYLQYLPLAVVYGLNLSGIKGEHDLANLTALVIKSELIMTAIVFPLKKLTAVPRPDTGSPDSFPSGHTAQAFVAATILHKEYGKDHPLYSVLGYATATSVGILRVMNDRHWASDVLVGAGIGIFSTNLAYKTHQYRWGKKHQKLSGSLILPMYNQGAYGVSMLLPIR